MPDTSVLFGKIVATPTPSSWSQAYNAGGLFAVVSLSSDIVSEAEEQDKDEDVTEAIERTARKKSDNSLQILGKQLLDTLEEEYFTLEEKNLETIHKALLTTLEKIPEEITVSLLVTAISRTTLYAFLVGKGEILLARNNTYSKLLEDTKNDRAIHSVSGTLVGGDRVIMETESFARLIPLSKILPLENPQEAAETLSPLVHHKGDGNATAIFISHIVASPIVDESVLENEEPTPSLIQKIKAAMPQLSIPSINLLKNNQRPYVLIAGIILVILVGSVLIALQKRQEAKSQALFTQVSKAAGAKYDEGQSLLGLNKNLARDDFASALKIIDENKAKFSKGSKQEEELSKLAQKINEALSGSSQNVEVVEGKNAVLELEKDSSALYATDDDSTLYALDSAGVSTTDKKSSKSKKIIAKDWSEPAGLGVFLGNVYVADKKASQIYKFASGSYTKSNYFRDSPDISHATSIAIDGSIYVLSSDGDVQKFTRGKQDSFTVSGLDTKLSSPTRIYTSPDVKNVYILDTRNARIVALDKNGAFQEEYKSKLFKEARDLVAAEKDKKLFILIKDKIYQTDLK